MRSATNLGFQLNQVASLIFKYRGKAREERWGWEVLGERRWERALREMDLEEDCTNLRIKRLETEGSSAAAVLETEVRKRWACLLRAQRTVNIGGGGGWRWRWLHGSCSDPLKQAAIVICS